jgi:hypothetical protein
MQIVVVGVSIKIEVRKRLSRGSVDLHTSQLHDTIGTPPEVPVPKKVTLMGVFILQSEDIR